MFSSAASCDLPDSDSVTDPTDCVADPPSPIDRSIPIAPR